MSEFDLIQTYFAHMTAARADVALGIGDDAALVSVPPGQQLALSVDTLVSGVHFLSSVSPRTLGHKALAVNLSDLAAMGAEPAWVTLALTLPEADPAWLAGFAEGFAALADRYGVALIGGDTTRGPLSLSVQIQGLVPEGAALRRAGAREGDGIYVTGSLGDAALCLELMQSSPAETGAIDLLRERLERPQPRVEAGLGLRGLASSAIDISDGLLADLGHILEASGVGASLELERLPLSDTYTDWLAQGGDWSLALTGGDDYELCFTAPEESGPQIERLAAELDLPISRIGRIERVTGLRIRQPDGESWSGVGAGFDHFVDGGGADER
jgi:thiamine-monophosphate kinase